MELVLISGFCSIKGMRVFDSPGWDTNPLQVSSQQTLVLIYLPRKDGKLSWLRRKRRSHKFSNLGKAGDRTGDLVVGKQRSYQLRQPRPPKDAETWGHEELRTKRNIANVSVIYWTKRTNGRFHVTTGKLGRVPALDSTK